MELQVLVSLLLVLISVCLFYYAKSSKSKDDSKLKVPGPNKSHEIYGNLLDVGKSGSLHEYLVELHEKFGEIASFWWGQVHVISVGSPDLFKKISHLYNRPIDMFALFMPIITEKSIQFANDSDIRERRALYDPPFSHQSCKNYYEILHEIGESYLMKWNNLPENEPIDLEDEMMMAAILSIVKTSFDENYFKDMDNVERLHKNYKISWKICEDSLSSGFPLEGSAEYNKFTNSKNVLFDIIKEIISLKKENVRSTADPNFLDTLVEANLSEDQILSDALTYMIGGFHTSGLLLTWTIYYLAKFPEIQERVYAECIDVLDEEPLNPDCIGLLKYTKQVIDETLRMSILAPFTARYSNEDIVIKGYLIPKKTPIASPLGVVLCSKDEFNRPEIFDPDRFLPENSKSRHSLAFQPFGYAGKRVCPGNKFALVEMFTFISTFIRSFKFKLIEDHPAVNRVYGLVTKPDQKILVHAIKRND